MLASASEHGDASVDPGGRQEAPWAATLVPAFPAKTTSTAYSGSTAMNASTAMAKPAEMSSCAASAAQESKKAAPTMAAPKAMASPGWPSEIDATRMTSAGSVIAAATASDIC